MNTNSAMFLGGAAGLVALCFASAPALPPANEKSGGLIPAEGVQAEAREAVT
jgi:hypothetical protein